MSTLHDQVLQIQTWRTEQDRVLKHLRCDGRAMAIDIDLHVENANLLVFTNQDQDARHGKGNLVVGQGHNFSAASNGFLAGRGNTIAGDAASVSAGVQNLASGTGASVSGGFANEALGEYASVSGGSYNEATGGYPLQPQNDANSQN